MELCKRKRVGEEAFSLERGKVFRREGEKRRIKIGNRELSQSERKGSV